MLKPTTDGCGLRSSFEFTKKALKMQADLEVHDLQQLRCGSMRNAELAIFGLVQSTVPLAKLL